MKKLDIYIIKKFLGTFFFAIALIISIAIIFDISEQLEDFLQKQAPLNEIVFHYYLNFIPYFVNLFSPLFVFIAVIFFTSKMASNSELIAILTGGVSFRRLMFPFFLSALFLTIFSYTLSNFVIPRANKVRYEFQRKYIWNATKSYERNIHKQIAPGVYLYMDSYNSDNFTGYQFSLEQFETGKLKSKLIADYGTWDTIRRKWVAHNYYIRQIFDDKEKLTQGMSIDTVLNITPEEFTRRDEEVESLDYFELNDYIEEQKMRGTSKVVLYQVEKYKRIAFPFSTFILTLIGVSIASRKAKGGIGLHIGIGLSISFAYILFMQVSSTFAVNGLMNPMIAVWIPNVLFLFLGIFLYKTTPK